MRRPRLGTRGWGRRRRGDRGGVRFLRWRRTMRATPSAATTTKTKIAARRIGSKPDGVVAACTIKPMEAMWTLPDESVALA